MLFKRNLCYQALLPVFWVFYWLNLVLNRV